MIWLTLDFHLHSAEAQNAEERQKSCFLTNFAAEVPELEGPVMTPRNNACIVQQELGRQNFTTVTCQGVLRTRDLHSKIEEFH